MDLNGMCMNPEECPGECRGFMVSSGDLISMHVRCGL